MTSARTWGFVLANYTVYRIRLVLVRAVEPVAQIGCGLVGRLAIEGHHRRRHARNPDDMGAPAFFGDPRHFDDEGSAGNSSFKAVPHDSYEVQENEMRSTEILRTVRSETSETKYEGRRAIAGP